VTTPLRDAAGLSTEARRRAAWSIRQQKDIDPWPELEWFNTAPCARHEQLDILCRRCGIMPRAHQRIGAAWMYYGLPGLLGDTVGSGKTAQILLMLAMCKQNGELGPRNRAVIVTKAAAVHDPWANELKRLTPGLKVLIADGDRDSRVRGYLGDWEVAVVSDRTLAPAEGRKARREGDIELLMQLDIGILVYDDVDPMRNPESKTAIAVNRLASRCTRVHGAHATPLQKQLRDLWGMLEPAGGEAALGSLDWMLSKYEAAERRVIVTADPRDRRGRTAMSRVVQPNNGITSNPARLAEFRRKVAPLVLRRTASDFGDDVTLPQVQYTPVMVDLSPRQRTRYRELSDGVLRRLRADGGVEITRAQAGAAFTRARQVCSGLATLDGVALDDSAKLDWAMREVTGDLAEEKVVCYVGFRPNVAALSARLTAAGVGHVLMWSQETDKRERQRRLEAFRYDPACRVLVGTTTIQTSLNLQVARYLIAVDTILNVQGMEQLFGRVRRVGSPYPTVYLLHLLAAGTLEEAFLSMLRREGVMSDAVWDEQANTFAQLTPRQMLRLIATGRLEPVRGEAAAA
jgi:SNF2 family DNA or RNA helicase